MAARWAFLGTTCLTLAAGGTAYSYKANLIERRRGMLAAEHAALSQKLTALNEKTATIAAETSETVQAEQRRRAVFVTLWEDRLKRYLESNREAKSCVEALPEALGTVKGLTSHYAYVANELRHFVGFDIASSKVHNMSLLLAGAQSNPLSVVLKSLRGLFTAEPLIHEVCESVEALQGVPSSNAAPLTRQDLTRTFNYCLDNLDAAVMAASQRYAASQHVPPKSENLVLHGLANVFDTMRVDSSRRDGADVTAKKKDERKRKWEERHLATNDDVHEALEYATAVRGNVTKPYADASLRYVCSDAQVIAATEQLQVWQDGASTFLVHQQAERALASYRLLLALSLTEVHAK